MLTKKKSPVIYADHGCRDFHIYGKPNSPAVEADTYIRVNAHTQQVVQWYNAEDERALLSRDAYEDPEYYVKDEEYGRVWLERLIGKELADQYVYERGTFRRVVRGERLPETVSIILNADGSMRGYSFWNVGYYDNLPEIVFDEEKAEAAISEAAEKLCPGAVIETSIETSRNPLKLANGQLVYSYSALVQTPDNREHSILFIIPIPLE